MYIKLDFKNSLLNVCPKRYKNHKEINYPLRANFEDSHVMKKLVL